jgi:hypothetical protein
MMDWFFTESQLLHFPQPPDSPNLTLSDFWLFGRRKARLTGHSFAEPEGLLEGPREFLEGISAHELRTIIESGISRARWVIPMMGRTVVAQCYNMH